MIASGQNLQAVYLSYGSNQSIRMLWFTTGAMVVQLALTFFPSLESFKWMSGLGATMSVIYRYG